MDGTSSLSLEVHTDLSIIDFEESNSQLAGLVNWIFLLGLLVITIVVIRHCSSGVDLSLGLKGDLERLLRYLELLLLGSKVVSNLSHELSGIEH